MRSRSRSRLISERNCYCDSAEAGAAAASGRVRCCPEAAIRRSIAGGERIWSKLPLLVLRSYSGRGKAVRMPWNAGRQTCSRSAME
jgi:hypothetical protein